MKKDRMNKKENKRGWKESDVRMGDWKGGGGVGYGEGDRSNKDSWRGDEAKGRREGTR